MLYSLRFVLLSIVLHGLLIYALYHGFTPYESIEPKKKAIKSYLIIEAPKPQAETISLQSPIVHKAQTALEEPLTPEAKPEPELETKPENIIAESDANTVKDEAVPKEESNVKEQPNSEREVAKVTGNKEEVNTIDISPKLSADPLDAQSISLGSASSYLQNLHQVEVERMSEGALKEYREPEAIGNKPAEPNRNKELRESSTSYAPKEANIIVLSEFGPNEKTVLMDGKCLTVSTTELDDPFWKGPKLWSSSSGCGKYDKFNGQLQKSLDKYLKK